MKATFKNSILKIYLLLILTVSGFSVFATSSGGAITKEKSWKVNKDSIIRILAIGNSFSDDAVEHYLYGLAKAGGYKVIIGNMYIGGCSLETHWKNASENKDAYNYRKIDVNGNKTKTPKVSLEAAIADEKWDFISFQQNSGNSGLFQTYQEPLPLLFNYVKERAKNSKVKYIWHQTWAYSQNHKNPKYEENYQSDQMTMYKGIMEASTRVNQIAKFDLLIPSGTAIQNARTSFLGDNLTRDGYHLNLYIGRYVASCTWYEALFGESVVGNTFIPAKVSEYEAQMGQHAAHAAIKKPFKVTMLKKFKEKK
jgi:hypothetical protein